MFHSLTHHSSHPDIDSDKTQQVGPCLSVYITVYQCMSKLHVSGWPGLQWGQAVGKLL